MANQTKRGISSIRPGGSLPTNAQSIRSPKDGSDLLGLHFVEPELGVCCITALGPIARKHAITRAERDQLRTPGAEPQIVTGLHYTLYYSQLLTQTEYLSSVTEVLNWIQIEPILPPHVEDPNVIGTLPITTPPANNSVAICPNDTTNRSIGGRNFPTCRYKLWTDRKHHRAII
jgi:hypothetical protein